MQKKLLKKVLPLTMAAVMVVGSAVPAMAAEADPWSMQDAEEKAYTITLDGKEIDVVRYTDEYLKDTGNISDDEYANALVNVYVPANVSVTGDSPILYLVNNSGWQANTYDDTLLDAGTFDSSADDGVAQGLKGLFAAKALDEGYIVVDAGLRTRSNGNHAPVTVADAKAVIRYLRYNDIGDTNKIFISGLSGGGALSVAIASDGNSSDFYEELYEIGAAGMTDAKTSTINDDILGTVAYCPITDLGHADGSYEYAYAAARVAILDLYGVDALYAPKMEGKGPNAKPAVDENGNPVYQESITYNEVTMAVSPILAEDWAVYVNGLGVAGTDNKFDTTTLASSGTLWDTMIELIETCLQDALDDGVDIIDVLESQSYNTYYTKNADGTYSEIALEDGWQTSWLSIENGKVKVTDVEAFLTFVALGTELKNAPAFTNQGTINQDKNENNLFGNDDEAYGYNSKAVWDLEAEGGILHEAYKTWDAYWDANEDLITKQMNMTDSIAYLTDDANGDSAKYWMVRHGIIDRDTSFANQTLLYLALQNDDSIETVDFAFTWYRGHQGFYDLDEAITFMNASIADAGVSDEPTADEPTTDGSITDDPATDDKEDDKTDSPKTADSFGFLAVAVVAAAGVAFAARRRVVR